MGDKPASKSMGFTLNLLFRFSMYRLRNLNTAGLQMLMSGSRLMKAVYLSLKMMQVSMGRLLMMLELRSGVNTVL